MFFKRAAKDKLKSIDAKSVASDVVVPAAEEREVPAVAAEALAAKEPKANGAIVSDAPARAAPLPANLLRRATNPATLGFETTAQLDDHVGLPGQEEALAALSAGARMRSRGHNIVVVGATGTVAIDLVLSEMQAIAVKRPPPSDWVYVANFDDRHAPRILELPPGYARMLAAAMDEAVNEMRSALIATLAGDAYQTRWRAIDAEFHARHQEALAALARTADAHSIALLRTPMGYAVAPGHDGGVVSPETFNNMPPTMQADVRAQISALEADLSQMLENSPQVDRQRRARLSKLNREVLAGVARAALAEPRRMFAAFEDVLNFLDSVEADAIAGANLLLPTIDIPDILGAERLAKIDETRLDAYRVNAFVAWQADVDAAPVVKDLAPDEAALFGSSTQGADGAPHMQFKAGLLHRANGGFLLLDAGALTASPTMLSTLLSVVAAGAIRPGSSGGARPDSGVFAQTIPLDVKIVLLSDAKHVRRMRTDDPRFRELFGAEVRFADQIERSSENERTLGLVIAALTRQEGLGPFEAGAVAELIELSSRMAGARGELSLALDELSEIARLADDCRAAASRKMVGREDVSFAWGTRQQWAKRAATPPDSSAEGWIEWLTKGPSVGMAMRLLVRSGERAISGPVYPAFRRASARIQWGMLRPASIDLRRVNRNDDARSPSAERTMAAYLAAEFGCGPLAVSAGLDSGTSLLESADETYATCAELMALLSAIADLRLSQTIAVAGTVDQFGKLRSERGINEAIEEYFDACRACAIVGNAGVIIPASCKSQLMLRQDVVAAAAAGEFSVWAVETAADCFAILTGLPAGTRDGERFADGDAYRLVDDGLQKLRGQMEHARHSAEASDS